MPSFGAFIMGLWVGICLTHALLCRRDDMVMTHVYYWWKRSNHDRR